MKSYHEELFDIVLNFFDDHDKTELWMKTPNPMYGWETPQAMCDWNGRRAVDIATASMNMNEEITE